MSKRPLPAPLVFGPLPVDGINVVLGLELEEGDVVMSGRAQIHAARYHPDDYSRLQPHVSSVVINPLYVGDDFKNPGKIELVGRIPALDEHILVAVNIEMDDNGNYNVASFYPVSEGKVNNRRQSRHLHILKRKKADN